MSSPPPSPPLSLDITVISAKHLKNVNWRTGDLSPYAIFWIDPGRRLSTKSDDYGSTSPVWNERFLLPLPLSPPPHLLSLEIYHSRPSDTSKPLVGSLQIPLPESPDAILTRSFGLRRPSGRPHGKIKLKLALVDRPVENYVTAPQVPHYYASAPPPSYPSPPPRPPPPPPSYLHGLYSDSISGYYPHYFPLPRQVGYGGAPSAPYDQNRSRTGAMGGQDYNPYDQNRPRGVGNIGTPSAPVEYELYDRSERRGFVNVGPPSAPVEYTPFDWNEQRGSVRREGLAGAMGGLTLEEGVRRERESDVWSRDGYSDNRGRYNYN